MYEEHKIKQVELGKIPKKLVLMDGSEIELENKAVLMLIESSVVKEYENEFNAFENIIYLKSIKHAICLYSQLNVIGEAIKEKVGNGIDFFEAIDKVRVRFEERCRCKKYGDKCEEN